MAISWVNSVGGHLSLTYPVVGPYRTQRFATADDAGDVIQVPKSDQRILDYELTDCEWRVIKPMLPNKSRGIAHSPSTPPAGVARRVRSALAPLTK